MPGRLPLMEYQISRTILVVNRCAWGPSRGKRGTRPRDYLAPYSAGLRGFMFQDPQACRNLHGYEDGTWVPSRRNPARTRLPLSGWGEASLGRSWEKGGGGDDKEA
jgi:hypothetical protein